MDFRDTPEMASFREEVRGFLKREFPPELRGVVNAEDERFDGPVGRAWRKKLATRGWIAPAWPKEFGGAGLTPAEQFVMNEEFSEARAPETGGGGVSMVGPTLIVHGTDEQREEHLSRILSGETLWCQGFSEPEAGSDLASLRMRAVRDGDDYVVNGQKIWTSAADKAHWIFFLVRTDPDAPKHKGISYLLADMKSPGVEVRPLIDLGGRRQFNEVFFDDVRVPVKNRVGEENRGWYIATTTLDFERSAIGGVVRNRQYVEDLLEYARTKQPSMLGVSPTLRYELSDRLIEAYASQWMAYRVASMQMRGLIPNYEASASKTMSSELFQRIWVTAVKVLGLYGGLVGGELAPLDGMYPKQMLHSLGWTLAGGSSEIQRNIIATRGLGLPRG